MFPVCPFADAKGNSNFQAKKLQIHPTAEIPCGKTIIAIINIDTLVSIFFEAACAWVFIPVAYKIKL
jgi:hypothetical protein